MTERVKGWPWRRALPSRVQWWKGEASLPVPQKPVSQQPSEHAGGDDSSERANGRGDDGPGRRPI